MLAIIVAFALMTVFFLAGLYVAGAIGSLSLIMMKVFSDAPLWNIMANRVWETYTRFLLVAIPLFIQTVFIYAIGYFIFARWLKLSYHDAAPVALIGASNHFEVAIATAIILFGLSSGAALATVVGVLIEVPLMLMLVSICKRTCHIFK